MRSMRRFGTPLVGYEGVARVTVEEPDTKTERSGCFEAAQFPSGRTAISFVPTELPTPTRLELRANADAEVSFHGTDADGWTITLSGQSYYSRLSWMFAPIARPPTEVSLGAQYIEARRDGARADGYGRIQFVVSNLLWHGASEEEPDPIELSVQDLEVTVAPIDDYAGIAQRLAATHAVEPTALVCIQAPPSQEMPLQAYRDFMVAQDHPVREAPRSPCRAGRFTRRLKEDSMKKKHLQPLTPAALYARVSSDRQDVDLSVSAQLRALKEYAKANGYSVAREYVDEAESGRVANRPQFREMIEEGSKPKAPFEVILVWKFSRFTRKREHAVAFKSQLRRKGIRVVSITEQAEDNATGRLLEGIIESVDEYYSENLAQEVVRGMREAASRGFFLASNAPFGYKKIKVQDGPKERPSLEVDPATAPVVKEIFEKSLRGSGLKELCKELNDRGITNRGKRWYKGGLHYVLRNEAYTGAAVWGKTNKGQEAPDPVRVEGAWPALVSRELFDEVQQAMSERAPKVQRPGRVGSKYLLSGLLRCGVCGRPYRAQGAKSGQFAYYICGTLFREGAGTCSARYLNAPRLETFVVEKIRERILNEETIVALVTLVAEEIDAIAGEVSGRLEVIEAELGDVRKRLEKLYEAIETSELTLEVLSPRIMSLRHREEQLEAAREDAETQLEQRREELPDTEEIARYVADFREFLKDGTIPEKKALIRNFIEGIEVEGDEATLTYTVPMPSDGATSASASVLDFVKSGPPEPAAVKMKEVRLERRLRPTADLTGRAEP